MTEIKVSLKQLDMMRHTIGVSRGLGVYRNHYMCEPESEDYDLLCDLVNSRLMVKRPSPVSSDVLFHLTSAGFRALGLMFPTKNDCELGFLPTTKNGEINER